MIEKLKKELSHVQSEMFYMEETDTAWSKEYTLLWKKSKVINATIKKLLKIESQFTKKMEKLDEKFMKGATK